MGLETIMYQLDIQFFWPLTEQISLDLDYTDCERPRLTYPLNESSTGILYTGGSWAVTNITPQLTVSPNNPTGYIKIGGVNIGMEKKPNLFQRTLHKLLGFDWTDK